MHHKAALHKLSILFGLYEEVEADSEEELHLERVQLREADLPDFSPEKWIFSARLRTSVTICSRISNTVHKMYHCLFEHE